jgi:Raf kinase inhibitor-like YbhB/YbcL family protein
MRIDLPALADGASVPDRFCYFIAAEEGHAKAGLNVSPEVRWSDPPAGTKSLALILEDTDAPSVGDDVNKEGRVLAADMPRVSFHHWILIDIPPSINSIPEGAESDPGGRGELADKPYGRRGVNDFTSWFASDPKMKGTYAGYNGPAPPWNDERVHRYHYRLYALDVPTLGLSGAFTAPDVKRAMEGHVLETAELLATCTLNPSRRSERS